MSSYRFRLPDGQVLAGPDPATIRRLHPAAAITHELRRDAAGNAEWAPYAENEKNGPVAGADTRNESSVIAESDRAPASRKRGRGGVVKDLSA